MVMEMKLDREEKEILDAYERGDMDLSTPAKQEKERLREIGKNTFRKNRRVTIRLYEHDLEGIKKKALEKGVPYQTLVSSMIHQYVEGDLVEK
jgi:predicted DNA binding CopG/RHH family protein